MASFQETTDPAPLVTGSGVQTIGKRSYSSILREKVPVLEEMMQLVMNPSYEVSQMEDIYLKYLPLYMKEYRDHLEKKKYFPYENTGEPVSKPELNRGRGINNRDEVSKFDKMMENFKNEFSKFQFQEEKVIPLTQGKFKYMIHSYLYMNEWCIRMYRKMDKEGTVDMKTLLNCIISYSRSIEELEKENPYGNDFMEAYKHIFGKLDKLVRKRFESSMDELYQHIFKNPDIIFESFWDLGKPKSIQLYQEQVTVIEKVMNSIIQDKPLLLMYKVPPGNGKTMLVVPLAAKLNTHFKNLIEARTYGPRNMGKDNLCKIMNLPKHREFVANSKVKYRDLTKKVTDMRMPNLDMSEDDVNDVGDQTKYILYICYNNLVRYEVASLCNTEGVDIPFWMALSEYYNGKLDTLIRPYKSCYADWRKAKRHREDPLRFGPLDVQWAHFQETTMNRPAIVIADLYSAMKLLNEFPNRFIAYFDETFAGSDNDVVIELLATLPKTSVLLSATLPDIVNIPTIHRDFMSRHEGDETTTVTVESNRLHVSCTVVGPDGCLYMPHNFVEEISGLETYIENIMTDPLKMRCYSPQMVYLMVKHMIRGLPRELHFENRFHDFGKIRHEDIRNYAIEVLQCVARSGNDSLFQQLKDFHPIKMDDMDKSRMLTSNAHYYQTGNTIHVSSFDAFHENVEIITRPILENAPRISGIIAKLMEEMEANAKLIEDIQQNPEKFRLRTKKEKEARIQELSSKRSKLKWVADLIVNSTEHGRKYGKQIYNPSTSIEIDTEILSEMNERDAKLLLSGIGLYHPDVMTTFDLEIFMSQRNAFRFIFSTPAIVYGTNMSICNVDIDETFISSRNSAYQLMGRAGRRGKKSFNAMVIFRNMDILQMVMSRDYVDVEAITAETFFQRRMESV
jgi:hypothetical protein